MSFASITVSRIWFLIPIILLWPLGIFFYQQIPESQSHSGLIKVDSPEVYSRERLVNDRFTQRWWLTSQLEKSSINFGNQAVIETQTNLRVSSETRFNNNTPTENNDAGANLTGEIKPDTPTRSEVTVSPIDDFRDGLAYREEIRGEIMETLLDDRHDLKGSTLYRLKFDTTLIPRKNNHDWALIEVTFSRGDENPSENDQLYDEWIELTNKQLNSTLYNLKRSFIRRNMDDADHLKFRKYLEHEVNILPEANNTSVTPVMLEETIILTSEKGEKTLKICDATDKDKKRQMLCLDKISDIIKIPDSSYFNDSGNMDMDRLRPLIRSYICKDHKHLNLPSTQNLCKVWERDVLFAFNKIQPIWRDLIQLPQGCQQRRGEGEQLSCKQRKLQGDSKINLAVNLLSEIYHKERQFLYLALADYLVAEYDDKFSDLMDIKSVNCSPEMELWNCHISVTKKPCLKVGDACDENNLNPGAKRFYRKLNCPSPEIEQSTTSKEKKNICDSESGNHLIFAYAITPKESTQRIGELQKNFVTLQGIIKMGAQQDGNQISEVAEILKEMRQVAHHIHRHPVVVGFSNHHSLKQHHVGWLLGPKFYLSSEGNTIDFRHVPIQNALSALISVPSWWRTMTVSINSCWVREDSSLIDDIDGEPYCRSNYEKKNNITEDGYEIRLPGGVDDINRRLGYQIARTPNIKTTNRPRIGEFCAKQKNAKLLIEGMDLWRSTAVTLGAQKADRIEVLPNMEAIIATFETIAVPVGRVDGERGNIYKDVSVVVWTSEGRTITSKSARIHFVGGSCPSKNKKKDIIKLPAIINNFYVGRKDAAKISIEGNDFSPDTVVMVGSVTAEIRLLPKGLIATFKKIPVSPENLQQLKIKGKCYIDLPVSVWTFRGKTTPGMIRVFKSAEDYKQWQVKHECAVSA